MNAHIQDLPPQLPQLPKLLRVTKRGVQVKLDIYDTEILVNVYGMKGMTPTPYDVSDANQLLAMIYGRKEHLICCCQPDKFDPPRMNAVNSSGQWLMRSVGTPHALKCPFVRYDKQVPQFKIVESVSTAKPIQKSSIKRPNSQGLIDDFRRRNLTPLLGLPY